MPEQDEVRLLADESFINYSLGHNKQDVEHWEKFLKENPDQQEKIAELKTLLILTSQNIQDLEWKDQLALLKKRIENGIQSPVVPMKTTVIRTFRRWAIAASIVGLLFMTGFAWYYFSSKSAKPETQALVFFSKPGERKSFQLPDGSTVILNADSRLSLSDGFNQQDRVITLNGEAYFDVVHNPSKPFIVQTTKMDVKVTGTAFNVKAYESSAVYETSLIRGSVELTLKDEKKKVMLHPNQKFVVKNIAHPDSVSLLPASGKIEIVEGLQPVSIEEKYNSIAETSWTENNLAFVDEPFDEVIKKLERWYGVSIELADPSLANYSFTATFRNESIRDVLAGLQFSKHFEFSEQNGKIIIKK